MPLLTCLVHGKVAKGDSLDRQTTFDNETNLTFPTMTLPEHGSLLRNVIWENLTVDIHNYFTPSVSRRRITGEVSSFIVVDERYQLLTIYLRSQPRRTLSWSHAVDGCLPCTGSCYPCWAVGFSCLVMDALPWALCLTTRALSTVSPLLDNLCPEYCEPLWSLSWTTVALSFVSAWDLCSTMVVCVLWAPVSPLLVNSCLSITSPWLNNCCPEY